MTCVAIAREQKRGEDEKWKKAHEKASASHRIDQTQEIACKTPSQILGLEWLLIEKHFDLHPDIEKKSSIQSQYTSEQQRTKQTVFLRVVYWKNSRYDIVSCTTIFPQNTQKLKKWVLCSNQ